MQMQMQMQKCISCRKAELLLCVEVEEIRVWIVEFGLSEAHCDVEDFQRAVRTA